MTFHWKDGVVPPFTGVAVYVTKVPVQTGLSDAAIVMLTGAGGSTVIVTVLDVAGLFVVHNAFDVRMQVTTSPLAGV